MDPKETMIQLTDTVGPEEWKNPEGTPEWLEELEKATQYCIENQVSPEGFTPGDEL